MKEIRDFRSYRDFLKSLFEEQKKVDQGTTLSTFAKALGLSTSGFQMILSGKRNLTVHKIHEMAASLRLQPEEHDFFENLVHYEQAKTTKEKSFYLRRLDIEPDKKNIRTIHLSRRELLSEWYFPAFAFYLVDRAYCHESGEFKVDYKLVKRAFGLNQEEVNELLSRLKTLGALDFQRSDKVQISFSKVGGFLTGQQYCLKVLSEVKKRVESSFTDPQSFFTAHVLSISEKNFRKFVDDYKILRSRYVEMAEEDADEGESVVQAFFAAFPAI